MQFGKNKEKVRHKLILIILKELKDIKKIYFVGIGGIVMSALARYFLGRGNEVYGYDRTETELTKALVHEGMKVHYADDVKYIPEGVDLVVYTPAIPKDHQELNWLRGNGYEVLKRSEVLGIISRGMKTIAVAGTHGKTTTSSIVTHILRTAGVDCTAFLGGISLNLGSNFVQGKSDWVVVEADEYDRSFLQLSPDIAIILSMDPDHLDIYGDEKNIRIGFEEFAAKTKAGGKVFRRRDLPLKKKKGWNVGVKLEVFGVGQGTYRSVNLRVKEGYFVFDVKSPKEDIRNIVFTLPGKHNVENATAAIAAAQELGIGGDDIKRALASFKGIRRRFEWIVKDEKVVYIDDYAHHPTELRSAIAAARALYPGKKLSVVFQPHLYSRTRDFQEGFAEALDGADDVMLMDIYPARELPMDGVTSSLIFDRMKLGNKRMVSKENLLGVLADKDLEVLMTMGAGDIDVFVPKIGELLRK